MRIVVCLAALAGCPTDPDRPVGGNAPTDLGILGIGDSYQDIWDDGDIPEVVGRTLGREVDNRSIGGQVMLGDDRGSIPNQYSAGDYGWVVATGGGNDLGGCPCGGGCDEVVNALITPDGRGAIPDLVDRIVNDGAQVAWVGYMLPVPDAEEFADCGGEWREVRDRMVDLTARVDGLHYVDGIEVGDGTDRSLYADDGYHTSEAGSAALAAAVVDVIREAEGG